MWQSFVDLGPYQWIGLIFGVIYVFLAARNNAICWFFGIISCSAIAVEDFTQTRLYADGLLQIFYVFMAFYGISEWNKKDEQENRIREITKIEHIKIIALGILVSIPIGFLFQAFTHASFPFLDSLSTSFSILATFLLVKRIISNWIYWLVIDVVYIYLYWSTNAHLFSLLFAIYILTSIYGMITWRKEYESYST